MRHLLVLVRMHGRHDARLIFSRQIISFSPTTICR